MKLSKSVILSLSLTVCILLCTSLYGCALLQITTEPFHIFS